MAEQQIYIESTGTILPDVADTQTQVEGEFRLALGDTLSLDPQTPQGRLIAAEVDARNTFLRNMAAVANQINPNLAEGLFLDAIWRLTGGQRISATQSTVVATLAGVAGTVIPAGSQASTVAGDVFELAATVTLDAAGVASGQFRSVLFGPVPAAPGALTNITTGLLGWETVTNPLAATLGVVGESDLASRTRRRNTLALQGVALPEAITSGLYALPGVHSLVFRENVTAATAVIDGVSMVAHSIFVCIAGGVDADIAAELLYRKSLGAGWNGTTTVNVTEPNSGQVYAVKFQRPAAVSISIKATVKVGGAINDPATAVRQALVDYAAGLIDGESGFVVGASVSPFELAGAVNIQHPTLYVQKMEIAITGNALGVVEIPISIQQIATLNANNVQVVIV